MIKINQEFIDDHNKVESEIVNLIESQEDPNVKKLFTMLAEKPDLSFTLFGLKGSVYSLEGLCGLLWNLNHWIVDDGYYCITRTIDDTLSDVFEENFYNYTISSGDYDESSPVTVEDMLLLIMFDNESIRYYRENEEAIENQEGEYSTWIGLQCKGKDYLENKWKEYMND